MAKRSWTVSNYSLDRFLKTSTFPTTNDLSVTATFSNEMPLADANVDTPLTASEQQSAKSSNTTPIAVVAPASQNGVGRNKRRKSNDSGLDALENNYFVATSEEAPASDSTIANSYSSSLSSPSSLPPSSPPSLLDGSGDDNGGDPSMSLFVKEYQDGERSIQTELLMQDSTTSTTILPDPIEDGVSPDVFLAKLVKAQSNLTLVVQKAKDLTLRNDFFSEPTEEQKAAYTAKVVTVVRTNDLNGLQQLHQLNAQRLDCFNRFGESLLHMACRRGFSDIVKYLLQQHPGRDYVRICDDCGRTVFHDACWNPSPQLSICKWILERDPTLLLISDNRGFTPFQYARPEHWPIWRKFLYEHRECFLAFGGGSCEEARGTATTPDDEVRLPRQNGVLADSKLTQ